MAGISCIPLITNGRKTCFVDLRDKGEPNEPLIVSKKKFVLRIDDDVYNALERWAADDFRSVNGQIEWLLAQALKQHGRRPAAREKPDPEVPRDDH